MKYFLDTEFYEYKKQSTVCGIKVGKPIDTIELISIGIVSEDNLEYYAICKDFDIKAAWNNEWLRENVLLSIFQELSSCEDSFDLRTFKRLINEYGKNREQIAEEIYKFIFPEFNYSSGKKYAGTINRFDNNFVSDYWVKDIYMHPEFYAYYADYDWVVFCWLFGRMIDLPDGFLMYCKDLKQILDEYVADKWLPASKDYTGREDICFDEALEKLESVDNYPKQTNEHNTLDDAKWNKRLYEFLKNM